MKPSTQKSSKKVENESPSAEPSENVNEPSELENTSITKENEVTEINSISLEEARSQVAINDKQENSSENSKNDEKTEEKFLRFSQNFPVFLGYQNQNRLKLDEDQDRRPNRSNKPDTHSNQRVPPPPSYYPQRPALGLNPGLAFIHFNPNFWCPYPNSIPRNTPAYLAQLVDIDTLFIVNNLELLKFIANVELPNSYLVQNNRGECIYLASEIFNTCTFCLGSNRGMKFVLRDVYENEVIYLNKYCGCSCPCLFCCYPVMEVYAPPADPLGAIIRVCQSPRDDFIIVDANENKIFKIRGSVGGNICGTLCTVEYSSLKRTGWVLRNVEDPETVSGHMYRMSIMTFLIPESSGVDKTRCMKLSLVHDLAECIVGDLTPFCGVDASEKHRQEEVAMKELTQMIGDSGDEIYKLYKEYEAQLTNESRFVKDLDRLDLILQAFEYEKLGDKPGQLEEFFTSTINKFNFPWSIDIVREIYKQRNLYINKEKSAGKEF